MAHGRCRHAASAGGGRDSARGRLARGCHRRLPCLCSARLRAAGARAVETGPQQETALVVGPGRVARARPGAVEAAWMCDVHTYQYISVLHAVRSAQRARPSRRASGI